MKYFISLILLLISFSTQAEIYRGVDEEGEVFYSDKELPNSELIPTPTPNAIRMPKPEPKKPAAATIEAKTYKSFSIVSPANDATFKDNAGNLSVKLSIKPDLNVKKGDHIRLSIDNQVVIAKSTTKITQIPNVVRGNHSLKAELVSGSGKTIMSSSIQFHMKRFSVLHKPKP